MCIRRRFDSSPALTWHVFVEWIFKEIFYNSVFNTTTSELFFRSFYCSRCTHEMWIHAERELTYINTAKHFEKQQQQACVWIFQESRAPERSKRHETRFSLTVTFTLSGFDSAVVVVVASRNKKKEIIKQKRLRDLLQKRRKKFEFTFKVSRCWMPHRKS